MFGAYLLNDFLHVIENVKVLVIGQASDISVLEFKQFRVLIKNQELACADILVWPFVSISHAIYNTSTPQKTLK